MNIEYLPLDTEAMNQAREFSNSSCVECVGTDDKCLACQDMAEIRQTELAHELVDEGNSSYPRIWHWVKDEPSGHDWVSSETIVRKGANGAEPEIRLEFKESWTELSDRYLDTEVELQADETYCPWCYLATLKYNPCPNCESAVGE